MRNRIPSIVSYLLLFVISLAIPVLHRLHTDAVIESMRPAMKLPDGKWVAMLLPVEILLLRWIGELSWTLPCAILILLLLAAWKDRFAQLSMVCIVAILQCGFTTFYAVYPTALLGQEWLQWTRR